MKQDLNLNYDTIIYNIFKGFKNEEKKLILCYL